nr:ribonuclease H-like domain-containing protein [Tanacetum cinerariifolium]
MPEPVENTSKVVYEPKVWTDAPIIEEYKSDSDNDSVSNVQEDKEKPSFAFTDYVKHVKTSRENIKKTGTSNHSLNIEKQDRNGHTRKGLGYAFTRNTAIGGNMDTAVKASADPLERLKSEMAWVPKRNRFLLFHVQDDPYRALKDKRIVDSECSRHMTRNKAHLADYQEFKVGSVAFGGSNGRITGKGKIKTGRLDFEDVYYAEELKHY